jgi:hypothetical protein
MAKSPAFLLRPVYAGCSETSLSFDRKQGNGRQECVYFAERRKYVGQQVRYAPDCESW